jgi:hypothetical protein
LLIALGDNDIKWDIMRSVNKLKSAETECQSPVKLNDDILECVDKFGYLGDMIVSGGGAEETSSLDLLDLMSWRWRTTL